MILKLNIVGFWKSESALPAPVAFALKTCYVLAPLQLLCFHRAVGTAFNISTQPLPNGRLPTAVVVAPSIVPLFPASEANSLPA